MECLAGPFLAKSVPPLLQFSTSAGQEPHARGLHPIAAGKPNMHPRESVGFLVAPQSGAALN